ncbi:SDR family NAD(P)-dependent oxidoreductase [Streptomyces bambusae]|nr:SDR family NAD(P)-dependent oxidoreductase [Streptomyces bambusae]MCB5164487.1 SDR family NAD(P)-dependent oxidoreductase [Streptomyces bambusae]
MLLGARRTGRLDALAAEIADSGGTAAARRLDVTDAADVQAFVRAARDLYGRVDVMVDNAGIMPLSPLEEVRVRDRDRVIDVNLRGVLYGIAAALPVMRAQGGGHIVNVASVGAYEVVPTAAVYCATKFAVRALCEGGRAVLLPAPSLRSDPHRRRSGRVPHGGGRLCAPEVKLWSSSTRFRPGAFGGHRRHTRCDRMRGRRFREDPVLESLITPAVIVIAFLLHIAGGGTQRKRRGGMWGGGSRSSGFSGGSGSDGGD